MPGKGSKAVIALFIGLMVAGILFVPLNTAVEESTGQQSAVNETVTAVYDTPVELEGRNIVDGTVTVWNSTNTVVPSSDYTIDQASGTINVSSSSTVVSDGEQISVTYDWLATSGTATTIAGFIPMLVLVVMVWIPARWIQENA